MDLEDAVPPDRKAHARGLVVEALSGRRAWVRVNRPGSELSVVDLEAVGGLAAALRLPKVESEAEVSWVRDRLAGLDVPLTAIIESARTSCGGMRSAPRRGSGTWPWATSICAWTSASTPADGLALLHVRSQMGVASPSGRHRAPVPRRVGALR